ncbi:MAG: hypothetical protein E3J88_03240 [Anaerolineales bacterium]|nr:MAG: hypothetical protein E3J88_03240 [Anaerolineales bacterium]
MANPRGAAKMMEQTEIPQEWLEEFEAAARRPLDLRLRYTFIHTYKPILDDLAYRAFNTMEDYRQWCEENVPDWLGYGRAQVGQGSRNPRLLRRCGEITRVGSRSDIPKED